MEKVATIRLRKAWHCHVRGYAEPAVVYAPNKGKANYKVYLSFGEFDSSAKFQDIRTRRAKHKDILLPTPHWLCSELSPQDRLIVSHAFGYDESNGRFGWRDHYCTAPWDRTLLRLAWELGLFSGPHGEREYGDCRPWGGAFFYLTELGRSVALSLVPTYPKWMAS